MEYTDTQIAIALQKLKDAGVDIDAIPLYISIGDVVRVSHEIDRPN